MAYTSHDYITEFLQELSQTNSGISEEEITILKNIFQFYDNSLKLSNGLLTLLEVAEKDPGILVRNSNILIRNKFSNEQLNILFSEENSLDIWTKKLDQALNNLTITIPKSIWERVEIKKSYEVISNNNIGLNTRFNESMNLMGLLNRERGVTLAGEDKIKIQKALDLVNKISGYFFELSPGSPTIEFTKTVSRPINEVKSLPPSVTKWKGEINGCHESIYVRVDGNRLEINYEPEKEDHWMIVGKAQLELIHSLLSRHGSKITDEHIVLNGLTSDLEALYSQNIQIKYQAFSRSIQSNEKIRELSSKIIKQVPSDLIEFNEIRKQLKEVSNSDRSIELRLTNALFLKRNIEIAFFDYEEKESNIRDVNILFNEVYHLSINNSYHHSTGNKRSLIDKENEHTQYIEHLQGLISTLGKSRVKNWELYMASKFGPDWNSSPRRVDELIKIQFRMLEKDPKRYYEDIVAGLITDRNSVLFVDLDSEEFTLINQSLNKQGVWKIDNLWPLKMKHELTFSFEDFNHKGIEVRAEYARLLVQYLRLDVSQYKGDPKLIEIVGKIDAELELHNKKMELSRLLDFDFTVTDKALVRYCNTLQKQLGPKLIEDAIGYGRAVVDDSLSQEKHRRCEAAFLAFGALFKANQEANDLIKSGKSVNQGRESIHELLVQFKKLHTRYQALKQEEMSIEWELKNMDVHPGLRQAHLPTTDDFINPPIELVHNNKILDNMEVNTEEKKTVQISGYLPHDPELKNVPGKDGSSKSQFYVFPIATKTMEGVDYQNIRVSEKFFDSVKDLKAGDTVDVSGYRKSYDYQDQEGNKQTYKYIQAGAEVERVRDTKMVLEGNLGKDPEIVEYNNGKRLEFTIAQKSTDGSDPVWYKVSAGSRYFTEDNLPGQGDLVKLTGYVQAKSGNLNKKEQEFKFGGFLKLSETIQIKAKKGQKVENEQAQGMKR